MELAWALQDIEDPEAREPIEKNVREKVAELAQKARAAGGLYVVGTERHESRRIDNQLRGRSGRQGDPGTSKFYLSLDEPKLIHIPMGVYHGFKCVSTVECMIINVITKVYDHKNPDEFRLDAFAPQVGYDWNKD